jgi:hypothetical protein
VSAKLSEVFHIEERRVFVVCAYGLAYSPSYLLKAITIHAVEQALQAALQRELGSL